MLSCWLSSWLSCWLSCCLLSCCHAVQQLSCCPADLLLDCPTFLLSCGYSAPNIVIAPNWCFRVASALSEKDPGSPNINQLCIIYLFKAYYDLFFKSLWSCRLAEWRAFGLAVLLNGVNKQHSLGMLNNVLDKACRPTTRLYSNGYPMT